MSEETALRLEFKLDLILEALQAAGLMLPGQNLPSMQGMGTPGDTCPACRQQIVLTPDYARECVNRTCGCTLPLRVTRGISNILTPSEPDSHARHRTSSDQVPPDRTP